MFKFSKCLYLTCLALTLQSYIPVSRAGEMIAGVGIHPEKFKRDPEELLHLMNNYGVMSFRTDFPWQQVERTKGKYNYPNAKFEKLLDLSLKKEMPFILILGYGNKNYEEFNNSNPWGKPTKESTIKAFSNYAQWSAENVNHDSVTFEIWNEWIQMAGKKNRKSALSDESAVMYAKLVNESCQKIKEVNPNITVIAGGISPLDQASIRWMEKVIDLKGMDCADGISLHPYDFSMFRKLNAKKTFNSISKFHNDLLSKYNKSYPLYITETGVPDGVTTNKSQSEVSDYIKEYFELAGDAKYIKGIWWYDFINDGNNMTDREHNFGLLKNNLEPKIGAQVFKSIAESKK